MVRALSHTGNVNEQLADRMEAGEMLEQMLKALKLYCDGIATMIS
jgi:hypothetical protein